MQTQQFEPLFERYSVRILAGLSAVLTEVPRMVFRSLQTNSGISIRSDHDRFLSNPFQLLINHPKIRRYEILDTDTVKK
jgi:hypothetical protein